MTKPFYLLTILFLIPFFAGCQGSAEKPWEGIKALELIDKQPQAENKTITVGLQIYLFCVKVDRLDEIQDQIGQTDTLPIKYNDSDSFTANGFIACRGDGKNWQKIIPFIAQASPKTKKHISLLLAEDLSNDVVIAGAVKPVSIIYHSGGLESGIGFDAGQTVLRLKASPLIGLRQACRLDVTPIYKTAGRNSYEFAFESAAFSARLQPRQYVLLAPANEKQKQTEAQTIGNIISYRQPTEDTADLCLIVCNFINSPL